MGTPHFWKMSLRHLCMLILFKVFNMTTEFPLDKSLIAITKKLFTEQTDNTFIQFFRYTIMGGTAFLVDFCLLYLLTDICRIHYMYSGLISCWFGLGTTYLISVFWVFSNRSIQNKWAEFGIFAIIGILSVAINLGLMWFFTELAGFYYLISKILATGICYIWNFCSRKFILFR